MRRVPWIPLALLLLAGGNISKPGNSFLPTPAAARDLSLEAIFVDHIFDGPPPLSIHWLGDGDGYVVDERLEDGTRLSWLHSISTGDSSLFLELSPIEVPGGECLPVEGWSLAPGGRHLLLWTGKEKRWRDSWTADHWLLDREGGVPFRLSDAGQEIHVAFAPDASAVAWVQDGRLWMRSLADGETRMLADPGAANIRDGDPDWVYEEEFGLLRAFWWSPDSQKIAWLRFELAPTPSFPLVHQRGQLYPELELLPYPKAGEANAVVTAHVLDLEDGEQLDFRPEHSAAGDEGSYIPRLQWWPDSVSLVASVLDRDQQGLQMQRFFLPDRSMRILLEESRPEGWIDLADDLEILADEEHFLWRSERDGAWRLFLVDATGSWKALTPNSHDIRAIHYVDEEAGRILLSSNREGPRFRSVEWWSLDGGMLQALSEPGGANAVEVAPDGSALVLSRSTRWQRRQMQVVRPDGSLLRWLHQDSMEDHAGRDWGEHRWVELPAADGSPLNGELFLPPGFRGDEEHPVLIYCYGGPGSQTVTDSWDGRRRVLYHRLMAADGYVVLTVDGRGTGGRGREFKHQVARRLGEFDAADQVAAVRWLQDQPWVASDRIALWGWSYGGYLSSQVHFTRPNLLAAAIAVAPVSDWRFYDTIYTERYMDQPADNPDGYHAGAPLVHAPQLNAPYLLIHGLSDDNVHPQNSLRLISELVDTHRDFELMLYPDKSHGIAGKASQFDVYRRMRDFLHRHLGMGPEAAD